MLCEQPCRRVTRRDDEVVVGPAKRLKQRREEPFGLLVGKGIRDRFVDVLREPREVRPERLAAVDRAACASPSERATASAESVRPSVINTLLSIYQLLPNNLPIAVFRTSLSPSAGSVDRRING